jgi:hypothetical protein
MVRTPIHLTERQCDKPVSIAKTAGKKQEDVEIDNTPHKNPGME